MPRRPTTGPFAGPEVASPTDGTSPDFVAVPISRPRYEFKTRVNRKMTVTDTSASEAETTNGRSPAEYLSHRGREALHVRQGPVSYSEAIEYRSYACYRHGARQIHTHSVGYSSDGDLVLMRREVSVVSDRDDPLRTVRRRGVGVDSATCLNPKATPPINTAQLDADADPRRWHDGRIARMKKYPGVRCPKNRKTRNRLLNDHFSTAATRALYDAAAADSDPEGLRRPADRVFDPLPPRVAANLLHGTEAMQTAEMKRLGLLADGTAGGDAKGGHRKKKVAVSIDSAAFRFSQLNARLKGELQHAVSYTEFMPGFIDDLETQFTALIAEASSSAPLRRSVAIPCKDGYGRLITHGVAAFYKLSSESETTVDGSRLTVVSLPPKKVFPVPDQRLLAFLRGGSSTNTPTTPSVHATAAAPIEKRSTAAAVGSSISSPEVVGVPFGMSRVARHDARRRQHRVVHRASLRNGGGSVTPDFGAVDCEPSSPEDDSAADDAATTHRRRLRFRRRVPATAKQRPHHGGGGMSRLVMPPSMLDS